MPRKPCAQSDQHRPVLIPLWYRVFIRVILLGRPPSVWLDQYDPEQQIYGMPDYLGGQQSALLNQDATLLRRKYCLNGAHMCFILYAIDPNMDDDTEEEMKEMIASSKGVEISAPCL